MKLSLLHPAGRRTASRPPSQGATDELLQLARVAGIGSFVSDLEKKRTQFSPELCELLGLPVGTKMPYEEGWRIVHEDDRPQMRALVEAAADAHDRGSWSGVCRLLRADGGVRWVSMHGRRIYHETRYGPVATRSMTLVTDITPLKEKESILRESERQNAEARLRDNEERLRVATNSAEIGVFEWDSKTDQVVWDNDNMYAIFGRTRAHGPLNGKQFIEEYLHPDDAHQFNEALKRARGPGGRLHLIVRIRRADGSQRWL